MLRAAVLDMEAFAAEGLHDVAALADVCRAALESPAPPSVALVRVLRLLAVNAQETLDCIRNRAEDAGVEVDR
ncbi:MAG: hypothetical protein LBQ32_06285 [Burkholderiaceae bacterium]|jgi:hypothetical protein|nr:hypothetical protein [Burkholderiaceae bacterium]